MGRESINRRSSLRRSWRRSGRNRTGADEHPRQVVAAEADSLAFKSDDARASRPDHLDLGAVVKPHLAEPMHQLDVADHIADAPGLAGPEQRKRNQLADFLTI